MVAQGEDIAELARGDLWRKSEGTVDDGGRVGGEGVEEEVVQFGLLALGYAPGEGDEKRVGGGSVEIIGVGVDDAKVELERSALSQ